MIRIPSPLLFFTAALLIGFGGYRLYLSLNGEPDQLLWPVPASALLAKTDATLAQRETARDKAEPGSEARKQADESVQMLHRRQASISTAHNSELKQSRGRELLVGGVALMLGLFALHAGIKRRDRRPVYRYVHF